MTASMCQRVGFLPHNLKIEDDVILEHQSSDKCESFYAYGQKYITFYIDTCLDNHGLLQMENQCLCLNDVCDIHTRRVKSSISYLLFQLLF